jgi:hypothetical protein
MGDIKIDTINDTFGETDEKISIVEEKEDVSELSMEKRRQVRSFNYPVLLINTVLYTTLPSNWICYGTILLI